MTTRTQHVISITQLVYRRLRRFGFAVLLIILIEQLWGSMQATSLVDFQKHSEQLMQVAVEQTAFAATQPIVVPEQERLQSLATVLQQQPLIISAAIYNRFGEELAFATNQVESDQVFETMVLVEEVSDGDQVLGYVHAVVDRQALMAQPAKTHAYLTYYGQFLLIIAVFAGIFVTSTFNRWRYRKADRSTATAADE